jgi:hypothetical protein
MGAIAYAIELLTQLPAIVSTGMEIETAVKNGIAALQTMQAENRDPTPAEWDALHATLESLRQQLDQSTAG